MLTAYVDSSNVYGSSEDTAKELREFSGGRLKVIGHPMSPKIFKPLMPHTKCPAPHTGRCFFAGEERSTEQPALASIHTLMVREHNRLADQLALENPHWTDEVTFQEARKIVIAINQQITYGEFLPRVLGPDLMIKFSLDSKTGHYDSSCSADIFNEFATAAFRFGHTLIKPELKMMGHANDKSWIDLKDHFFKPDMFMAKPHLVDDLMRGAFVTPMEAFDQKIAHSLTSHLFEQKGVEFSGGDLAALNVQRGRDHGLRGYLDYLTWSLDTCGTMTGGATSKIESFNDLAQLIGLEPAHQLSLVYSDVRDIDLFTGGLSERPLPGAVVGLTFGCIIAHQFHNLKTCDRFWWRHTSQFTPDQLEEIGKVTLSTVICRNWNTPGRVQPRAFDLPAASNPVMECMAKQNHLDITKWRDVQAKSGVNASNKMSCDVNGWIIPTDEEREVGACTTCRCHNGSSECGGVLNVNCHDVITRHGLEAVKADSNCAIFCSSFNAPP